jgi:hypothetical protein
MAQRRLVVKNFKLTEREAKLLADYAEAKEQTMTQVMRELIRTLEAKLKRLQLKGRHT